jgi:hypothetical protein
VRDTLLIMTRWAALSLLLLVLPASAADSAEVIAARAAYDRGVAAFADKDYRAAAAAFAEADAKVRNDVALGAAIDAAMRADDAVLVMQLVERAVDRPAVKTDEARAKFGKRVGRVVVTCTCTATLDGRALPVGKPSIVVIGHHALVLTSGSKTDARAVEVGPASTNEIAWTAPVDAPRVQPSGISPAWFWIGVGATVVLAGATTVSGLAVRADHDAFERECTSPSSRCSDLARDGVAGQRRTNVLLAVSIVSFAATTVVGAFAVRWTPVEGGSVATVSMRF